MASESHSGPPAAPVPPAEARTAVAAAPGSDRGRTPSQPPAVSLGRCRSVEEYQKLNRIGEGTYGIVYRARDRRTGDVVALKKVRLEKETSGLPLSSLREIALLQSLRHINIVRVHEVAVGQELTSIFMVMEYCEHDLATLLDNMAAPFSPSDVKCLMQQLLDGLEYCHSRFIVHRDLKMSNLLLNNRGILKIADFGLARRFEAAAKPMTPRVVTLWYRAPEVLLGAKVYTEAVDLWSVGCIFGELLKHEPLLPGQTEARQVELMFDLLGTPNDTIWPAFSSLFPVLLKKQPYNNLKVRLPTATENTIALLNRFLTYDPQRRITVHEALTHPYFTELPPRPYSTGPTAAKRPDQLPRFPDIHSDHRGDVQRRRRAAAEEAGRKRGPDDDSLFARFDAPSGAFNLEDALRDARRRRLELPHH